MNLMGNEESGQSINDCWLNIVNDVTTGDVPDKPNFRIWLQGSMVMAYLPSKNDNPNLLTQTNMAQAIDECQVMVALTYFGGVPSASVLNGSRITSIDLIQEVPSV
jgi:hypothetical protein